MPHLPLLQLVPELDWVAEPLVQAGLECITQVEATQVHFEVKPYIMYKNTKFESSAKTHFLVTIQGFTSEMHLSGFHLCDALMPRLDQWLRHPV